MLEYSESRVNQILKDIPPVGSFEDRNSGCALTLQRVGEINDMTTVNTLEEFLEPDFNKIWAKQRSEPGASVDVKSLVEELHKQTIADSRSLRSISMTDNKQQ